MRTRPRTIFSAVVVALVGIVAPVATTGATAASGNGSSTQTLQAQAAQISAEISQDAQQMQVTSEQYDQANANYRNDLAKLASIKRQLRIENRALKIARYRMRRAVVTAYVYGVGAQAEVGAVLSGHNLTDANTLSTYASVATTELNDAVVSVRHAQQSLVLSEQNQASITNAAAGASTSASTARQSANAAQANAKTALSKVQGELAQVIAEQAAARAKAAAEAAAVAASAQARSQDQLQAQSASNLAQTVAALDPTGTASTAAVAALNSSNAANSVGAPAVILGSATTQGDQAVAVAISVLGVPYVWGGSSANSGFDCSGLSMYAWQTAGVSLTHSAYDQYLATTPIPVVNNTITLEPGDLLYYFFPDDGGQPVTHDVIYVGSGPYGTTTVIAAPQTGENVMYQQIYWGGFVGAGRP